MVVRKISNFDNQQDELAYINVRVIPNQDQLHTSIDNHDHRHRHDRFDNLVHHHSIHPLEKKRERKINWNSKRMSFISYKCNWIAFHVVFSLLLLVRKYCPNSLLNKNLVCQTRTRRTEISQTEHPDWDDHREILIINWLDLREEIVVVDIPPGGSGLTPWHSAWS